MALIFKKSNTIVKHVRIDHFIFSDQFSLLPIIKASHHVLPKSSRTPDTMFVGRSFIERTFIRYWTTTGWMIRYFINCETCLIGHTLGDKFCMWEVTGVWLHRLKHIDSKALGTKMGVGIHIETLQKCSLLSVGVQDVLIFLYTP